MPTYLPRFLQAVMASAQHVLDGGVALVEGAGDEGGVAVEAEGELGHVVGADGEAVEVVEELRRRGPRWTAARTS